MKKIVDTISNIFKIEELRTRILTTLLFLVVFRLGSFVVLPGVDPDAITAAETNEGYLGILNTFSGGAFNNVSVFALGIMPYISASIVLQLLTFAVPYFQRLQKDGESGRKTINQYTRYLTILITLVQGYAYLSSEVTPENLFEGMNTPVYHFLRLSILVSGTMFCMWIGERITEKGIGNGISMLIMVGIISRLPFALTGEVAAKGVKGILPLLVELFALFGIIMFVVLIQQATRRIAVQYAKQAAGGKQIIGQRQYLPIKLISAGVMPIIFAQAIMIVPALVGNALGDSYEWAISMARVMSDFTSWQYNVTVVVLIVLFTYFYTAITVNPNQIADDLKRNGGFIPGVKPGQETSNYIDDVLTKITLPGALSLSLIAILPAFAYMANIEREFAAFYGGTSLLILIGVVLDTLQQIESFLLMKKYDGMMESGRIRGRMETSPVA